MKKRKIDWLYHFVSLFVVFLGVTAGFVLQNRKENSANREMEYKYRSGIISDIDVNILELEEAIIDDSLWLEQNNYALRLLLNGTLPKDSADRLMYNMAHFSEFTAQTNTYENITNSGNLNMITSYDHKQAIVKYYKSLEDFELLEEYFKDFNTRTFMPYMNESFDMFTRKLVVDGEEKSIKFKNIFGTFYSLKQQRIAAYRQLLLDSNETNTILQ